MILKKIFQTLPQSLQSRIRWSIARTIEQDISKNLPEEPMLLDEKHVKNCQVVTNRRQLLKYLPSNGIVAEIGVYRGDFSDEIFKTTAPKKMYLIDQWKGDFQNPQEEMDQHRNYTTQRFEAEIKEGQVQIINDNSLTALQAFPDNYFDWVYLDSDHSYEVTLKELELLSKKVKDEGIICGHDYTKGNWYAWVRLGVIEAVNEFCVKHHYEFAYFTFEPSMYFSWGLRKLKE